MATSNHSEPKPSKQTANRALRVVRIIHQLDKLAIPVEFLRALTTVGIPYLNIAFLGINCNNICFPQSQRIKSKTDQRRHANNQ